MKSIPVYNKKGKVVDTIDLPTHIRPESGRVSIGNDGLYYKGVGLRYKGHSTEQPHPSNKIMGKSSVFYAGYQVVNPNWEGKFGVFRDRFQPYFSDYIGGCGPKELKLIPNAREFRYSGVEVLDYCEYAPDQFYFTLNYTCERKHFIHHGSMDSLLRLTRYLADSNWNIPWDKNSITDISANGEVYDVADMFQSPHLVHKLGTIYSIFYSLARSAPHRYIELLHYIGLNEKHKDDTYTILAAMRFLTDAGHSYIDIIPPEYEKDNDKLRWFMIANVLVTGRNCAHQEFPEWGEKVVEQYREKIFQQLGSEELRVDLWDLGLGKVCIQ